MLTVKVRTAHVLGEPGAAGNLKRVFFVFIFQLVVDVCVTAEHIQEC